MNSSSFRWKSCWFGLSWLLVTFLIIQGSICGASEEGKALGQDNHHIQVSHEVADVLVDALSQANSPIHGGASSCAATTSGGSSSRTGEGTRAQRWMKGIRSILFTSPWMFVASSSRSKDKDAPKCGPAKLSADRDKIKKKQPSSSSSTNSSKRRFQAFEAFRFYNKMDMQETMVGAKLLSGSFQLLSSGAGFVADTVRVTGDTAAGLMGSSVKIMGTSVKYLGAGLNSAGRILADNSKKSTEATNHPSADNWTSQEQEPPEQTQFLPPPPKKQPRQYMKRSRQAAAASIRFAGGLMDLAGESILIAGAAAESLASSTAGVAEETVRVLENLAGTVSLALSLRGGGKRRHPLAPGGGEVGGAAPSPLNLTETARRLTPPFLSFGSYDDNSPSAAAQSQLNQLKKRFYSDPSVEDAIQLVELLASDAIQFGNEVSAEVEGVHWPSALLFCYLLAVMILPSEKKRREGLTQREKEIKPKDSNNKSVSKKGVKSSPLMGDYVFVPSSSSASSSSSDADADDDDEDDKADPPKRDKAVEICFLCGGMMQRCLCYSLGLPWSCFRWSCQCLVGFVFSRGSVLLCAYTLVWIYLSRLSQHRVAAVQRRAESVGYRNGITSITETSPPTETLIWLNHALDNLWRVRHSHTEDQHYYPLFVSRAFRATTNPGVGGGGGGESYGGLEPYISSAIGNGLVRSLEVAKVMRPTDVAYVSLFSLSLGRRPPRIRTIKVANEVVKGEATQIELDLEVDAFLEDLSMVFEVKLSSLSYSLLPSTKINIFNLDFRASIKAVLVLGPQFPFVSEVQLSMSTQPHCDFRAAPISKDSGMNGVELGSIPFLNDWIREAIRSSLSNFVSPRYLTIDVAELLHRGRQDQAFIVPNLKSLRRETGHPISSPRTSIPDGIAITSVADHMESRHSSIQAAGSNMKPARKNRKKKPMLRPVTELSRLALDRHDLKENNLVRPVTELARLGMDRWLDSTVMTKSSRDN